jgi:hypothetical protein
VNIDVAKYLLVQLFYCLLLIDGINAIKKDSLFKLDDYFESHSPIPARHAPIGRYSGSSAFKCAAIHCWGAPNGNTLVIIIVIVSMVDEGCRLIGLISLLGINFTCFTLLYFTLLY